MRGAQTPNIDGLIPEEAGREAAPTQAIIAFTEDNVERGLIVDVIVISVIEHFLSHKYYPKLIITELFITLTN